MFFTMCEYIVSNVKVYMNASRKIFNKAFLRTYKYKSTLDVFFKDLIDS